MSDLNDDPDVLARLLRVAGRREEPPEEIYRRALEAATATWEHKVRARRRTRLLGWTAAAGGVAALSVLVLLDSDPVVEPAVVARVDRIVGRVEARNRVDGDWVPLTQASGGLRQGTEIRTGRDDLAGVLLANGASLRLAPATAVAFESPTRVRLRTGRVYLDTGSGQEPGQPVEITTRAGTATDVGTQFEIQYDENICRVRVREGRVHFDRPGGRIVSEAGDEVVIVEGGGVRREKIARDAREWRWTESVAPAPRIDGQPVSVLLAWVSRETGRPLRFDPPEIEQRARRVILHGDVSSLAPLEALAAMLETTDFAHALLEDGTIVIRSRDAG
jgi:ferric-dicitrate binding protein FerR (iron transport regulator)